MSLEMASAEGSALFSPSLKMAPQKPACVEKNGEKSWDVLAAIAYANGHNGEGASCWEGPCRTRLIG